MKKAILITSVFLSSLMGAGFSSGNEILYYFSQFKKYGFFGIVIASFLIAFLQYVILTEAKRYDSYTFDKYCDSIALKPLSYTYKLIAYFFMMIVFTAMISGFSETLNIIFGIKKLYGAVILLIICFIILKSGYNIFLACESTMSAVIIIAMLYSGLYLLFLRETPVGFLNFSNNWQISAVSYSGYNILTNTALLCILSKECDKRSALISSIFTGAVVFVVMSVFWYIICIYSGAVKLGNIPLLTICLRHSLPIRTIYTSALFLSMLTTAVSNGYTLKIKLDDFINKNISLFIIIASGFLLSAFDFSFFVDKLYRAVGIFSIIFSVNIVIKKFHTKKHISFNK